MKNILMKALRAQKLRTRGQANTDECSSLKPIDTLPRTRPVPTVIQVSFDTPALLKILLESTTDAGILSWQVEPHN